MSRECGAEARTETVSCRTLFVVKLKYADGPRRPIVATAKVRVHSHLAFVVRCVSFGLRVL